MLKKNSANKLLSSHSVYHLHLPLIFSYLNFSYLLLAQKFSWVTLQVKKLLRFIMNYTKNLNSEAWYHHLWATVHATFHTECLCFSISLLNPVSVYAQLLSHVWLFVATWTQRLLCPWDFPGKNTGVGCYFVLQGIFPMQGWKPSLLHWQADSLPLGHLGSLLKPYPPLKALNTISVWSFL